MKNWLILTIICFALSAAFGQEPVPRFEKYPVLETGCSYYLPGSTEFELSLSEDGSKVITGEVMFGNFYFSTITVEFMEDLVLAPEEMAPMIESYLGYLMSTLGITSSAGIGWGHTLESNPNALGGIDYWRDDEGTEYAVKSWCDAHHLSVLLLYGNEEYPYFEAQQMFFDGFRFPEN